MSTPGTKIFSADRASWRVERIFSAKVFEIIQFCPNIRSVKWRATPPLRRNARSMVCPFIHGSRVSGPANCPGATFFHESARSDLSGPGIGRDSTRFPGDSRDHPEAAGT
jgi:hypothetical protein